MSNGIQFRIQATKEQLEQMEHQCLMTEQLMAGTLAKRIEGMKAEDAFSYILDWFKSVRNMAHANWVSCNIQSQAAPIGEAFSEQLEAVINKKERVEKRLAKVNAFLQEVYCVTPNAQQLELLRKMME